MVVFHVGVPVETVDSCLTWKINLCFKSKNQSSNTVLKHHVMNMNSQLW